jgi:hypothetical protein
MRFRTTLRQEGRTATGFEVPPEVVTALGTGKRPPVRVTINGYTYRSTVAAYGDVFMLPLAAEHRTAAGVAAGDDLDVEVELDEAPRVVVVPDDLAAALAGDPAAQATWDTLSYSNKRWHVLNVEGTKNVDTRRRRIEKALTALREGRPR